MSQYFLDLYERSGGNLKVELNLYNYATAADMKGTTDIDTSTLPSKTNLKTKNIENKNKKV